MRAFEVVAARNISGPVAPTRTSVDPVTRPDALEQIMIRFGIVAKYLLQPVAGVRIEKTRCQIHLAATLQAAPGASENIIRVCVPLTTTEDAQGLSEKVALAERTRCSSLQDTGIIMSGADWVIGFAVSGAQIVTKAVPWLTFKAIAMFRTRHACQASVATRTLTKAGWFPSYT